MSRVILLADLDYFYAQAEEIRKPALKGRPVAVCMFSGRSEFSGAVATANYAARALGVKAGMPIGLAKSKSPDIVLLPADREYYTTVSDRIMEILRSHADKFEQVSIDEAYLDVSERTKGDFAAAQKLAKELREKIFEEEKLTCSIGIGPNKLLSKMAAGVKKPDGLTVVMPKEVGKFLATQDISDLHGVGPKTIGVLSQNGIMAIKDLASAPPLQLQEWFGQNKGLAIHEKARGIDNSEVEGKASRQFSRIATLKENTSSPQKLIEESAKLAQDLCEKAIKEKVFFRTVSIILISNHLEDMTRSKTLPQATQEKEKIMETAEGLFNTFFAEKPEFVCRRFGVRISGFEEPKKQKSIFEY